MLDEVEALTLEQLNLATHAWLEREKCCAQHFSRYVFFPLMLRSAGKTPRNGMLPPGAAT
jgi:hypothetical protein